MRRLVSLNPTVRCLGVASAIGAPFAGTDEAPARLRAAERNLAILGRVNPLALEEFEAMTARHQFLAEQLEDLRQTRTDLLEIVAEVDGFEHHLHRLHG